MDVASIVKHLRGIRCPSIAWEGGHAVLSCPDAIGGVLEKETQGSREEIENSIAIGNVVGQCPDCGNLLVYQEGCFLCRSCGYTKCG